MKYDTNLVTCGVKLEAVQDSLTSVGLGDCECCDWQNSEYEEHSIKIFHAKEPFQSQNWRPYFIYCSYSPCCLENGKHCLICSGWDKGSLKNASN